MMRKLLQAWDDAQSLQEHARLDQLLSRRSFLTRSLKTVGTLALLPAMGLLPACEEKRAVSQHNLLNDEPWLTFATVQQHLFPADGNGPSASDLHASLYLKFVLDATDTDPEERDFIYKGIEWLNALAQQQHQALFVRCSTEQQNDLIRTISQSRSGERWISFLLTYLIEALLSDPVYGGNPDAIGWQWLQHQAGFPRPSTEKTYPHLLDKRHD
jgi:gluconate 2-dehydrogenase gamma chain